MTTPGDPGLAGLLLAAGASRRFGAPKPLALWRGRTLVAHGAERLAAVCPAGVVVVSGAVHDPLRDQLPPTVTLVRNERWTEGLATSLACGLQHLPPAGAVLVMPCDLPAVSVADLARLVAAWRGEPGQVAVAAWDGQVGPPAIFPRSRWPELLALEGDQGARALLAREAGSNRVPMPAAALDVDTPAELARLAALLP